MIFPQVIFRTSIFFFWKSRNTINTNAPNLVTLSFVTLFRAFSPDFHVVAWDHISLFNNFSLLYFVLSFRFITCFSNFWWFYKIIEIIRLKRPTIYVLVLSLAHGLWLNKNRLLAPCMIITQIMHVKMKEWLNSKYCIQFNSSKNIWWIFKKTFISTIFDWMYFHLLLDHIPHGFSVVLKLLMITESKKNSHIFNKICGNTSNKMNEIH